MAGYHRHGVGGSGVGTWLLPKVHTFEGSEERTIQSLQLKCTFDMFSALAFILCLASRCLVEPIYAFLHHI